MHHNPSLFLKKRKIKPVVEGSKDMGCLSSPVSVPDGRKLQLRKARHLSPISPKKKTVGILHNIIPASYRGPTYQASQ